MPKVTDPRDLFLHELGVVLAAEKKILQMLPRMAKEANDGELKKAFERHLEQTERHVDKVEDAFRALGEQPPSQGKAPGLEGLELQHKAFASNASEDVLPDVLDAVAVTSAAHVEHYEIAAYEGLITTAEAMGATDVVELLEENLRDEQETLAEGKQIAERLAREGARDVTPA